jgi:hypothetical protein
MAEPAGQLLADRAVAEDAAERTLAILDTTTVTLVGVREARLVSDAVGPRRYLHAGPPLSLDELPGPLRGALVGALLLEGEAADRAEAARILDGGELELAPCQEAAAGGAIAGVVSPSMPVVLVESSRGNRAFSPLNEGLGNALRFGANSEATLRRLRDVVAPVLDRAAACADVDLTEIQAEALRRGDEGHNRTVAAGAVLVARLASWAIRTAPDRAAAADALEDARCNPHFFNPFSIAAAKAIADAAHGIPGSPIVTGAGGNGLRFGIRVSGLGERWFTAPAPTSRPMLFEGFSPEDAQPMLGDSPLIETIGLGGCALSAAPAVCSYVGGAPADLSRIVSEVRAIAAGVSSRFLIPFESFAGTPLGLDVTRVAVTGIEPVTTTGLAHRRAGVGQVGAGLTRLPVEPFADAARALERSSTVTEEGGRT